MQVKKSQPKDIDLTLPGWGCWGGKNIKVSKRKKRRFILRVPKDLPRKDENKGDVIILEQDNPKIKVMFLTIALLYYFRRKRN